MAGNSITIATVLFAIAGGILPTLLWLWFWLKEDAKKPEPKRLLVACFTAGFLTVAIAIVLEDAVQNIFTNTLFPNDYFTPIVFFAIIEETLKYFAVYMIAFRNADFDEPIDAIVYMITGALGFAAIENILYITAAVGQAGAMLGIIAGNLRFVGATLLHTATSGIVGIAVGLAFYMNKEKKHLHLAIGLITASLLHTLFNLSIIKTDNIGEVLFVFLLLWLLIVPIMLFFEKVKKIHSKTNKEEFI
ncbi:MAG: hypothetical protein COZ49_01795 [Candidatus Yonathbacteria bacterium CG_4_10_14_3_um_filter_47_65]|uniref:Protease PrsW n=2 Tax=Parcubacteria group TaxID=1794811 RepID=A0A2M8D875_9BACT|nr:MAG: hypothetical protein AUJ44_02330 [Candidatus Nomurabacteria bacterium CG1_02_47_685]PIP03705.1 MAG: hypothetical protein COX54_02655 [Candidatus Yonathbacteria bacterium CG23_combo_of_CG06-09_8_20_14_all_46_18]PIQ32651.1 MAG: hypothetical protein COW61_01160 [Candidatus Yonathbacteria bacterium CG17_big_fil_post_rev_8_21_14_2_50_46_19]PIX56494.1 MAG: hypothetical protein COZ49_01795 [Candidatus Yonathbacteria bacterium CG_4_10_14_3_um_filter_47_65]PIY57758.1 MAG: hypothetical protein CO